MPNTADIFFTLGEGNLICFTGSGENYFGSVG